MKIYNVYLDELKVNETTLEFAVEKLEGHKWFKKGTVKEMLEKGEIVQNPFCMYANSKETLLKSIS